MSSAEQLRHLPAVDQLLRDQRLITMTATYPRPQLVAWIRSAVNECRQAMLNGTDLNPQATCEFVVNVVERQQRAESGRRQQPVINATGILLHTNLGRAPLSESAVQRMLTSSGYANVEMNLQTGKRNKRGERVCDLLSQLTGAEDAAIVNNCAAATMLVLQTMASGREVIVSRGQLVEIGGGFRLPEVFAASGAVLKEVGTTNRTYLRDYANAITENTGAIIRVHRSNFFLGGFTTEPDIADMVALGKEHNVPVIDDLGSGCMHDLTEFGLNEPTVPDSVAAGADVTLFSGDKLFGGPQAGLIVGRTQWVEAMRKNPVMRALRVDKVTLAAIEATTEIHLSENAAAELPLLQMLSISAHDVRDRCEQVLGKLDVPTDITVDVAPCTSQIGGGSVPGSEIPSYGLHLTGPHIDALSAQLRRGSPAVLGRIQDDTVILDLRTVHASQVETLAQCVAAAISSVGRGDA